MTLVRDREWKFLSADPCPILDSASAAALLRRAFAREPGPRINECVGVLCGAVGAADLDAIDDVANCPTQFQAYIAGTDWRVHVVGDDVYACEIQCEADDYRVAELHGFAIAIRPAVLPESIAARCHALAHSLNLPLAGIDLRRTRDGAWYCFEVNPSPGFTYYERATGQPLSAAVARLLSGASSEKRPMTTTRERTHSRAREVCPEFLDTRHDLA